MSGGQNVGLEISRSESCLNSNKYWDVDEFETFRSQNKRAKVIKSELDRYLDEELLDSIGNRGFVCQGPELAGITVEYRGNPIRQIAFNIRFDPAYLVSLTDSDAKIDEMIQAVEHRSLALRIELKAERQKKE